MRSETVDHIMLMKLRLERAADRAEGNTRKEVSARMYNGMLPAFRQVIIQTADWRFPYSHMT